MMTKNKPPPPPGSYHRTLLPDDAHLGGYKHGDVVDEETALQLAGGPDFVEKWLIVPSEDWTHLTLRWGDGCDVDELKRANAWNRLWIAHFGAVTMPKGHA